MPWSSIAHPLNCPKCRRKLQPQTVHDLRNIYYCPCGLWLVPHEAWVTVLQGSVDAYEQPAVAQSHEREFASLRPMDNKSASEFPEFALEVHLEDFIARNWSNIDWGSNLKLYKDGRQFPISSWRIDFLALDTEKNDLVVIELKRGQESDIVVGKVFKSINWVRENIAKENQRVRGIIIAQAADEVLNYAVKDQDDIAVKIYRVDFRLLPLE